MRFDFEQRFAAAPAQVIAAYTDPALYDRMVGMARVDAPEVLDVTRDGDAVIVRVRFKFIADLPAPALAVIDAERLTWIDQSRYDLATATSTTRLQPDHYPDRMKAWATSRFEPDPGDPARTRRAITGELTVRAPLVGGRVERAIVDGLREHLDDEARVVAEHLGAGPDDRVP